MSRGFLEEIRERYYSALARADMTRQGSTDRRGILSDRGLLYFTNYSTLVDRAQMYLAAIPSTEIKDSKAIERLIGYLERNRKWIPCYAMRRKLKLPNSSNPVERCNNLVTARRQKHHGMSWSKNGSYALTALSAVTLNNATVQWLEHRTLPLTWVKKKVA